MSTNQKKRTKRETLRQRRAQQKQMRNIALVAIGMLLVALVIWMIVSGSKTEQSSASETPAPVSNAPAATIKQYDAPPEMTIDVTKEYYATLKMATGGEIVIQLLPEKAPVTVNNFVFLAREGYYDGTTFHRVLADFMAQGGDPTGTGGGSPGYQFQNEDSDLTFDKPGVVAMANAGRDTNGSQFFITFGATEWLDGGYTIFGQVIEGMDVVMGITLRDPQTNPQYSGDVIESITIEEK